MRIDGMYVVLGVTGTSALLLILIGIGLILSGRKR